MLVTKLSFKPQSPITAEAQVQKFAVEIQLIAFLRQNHVHMDLYSWLAWTLLIFLLQELC